MLKDSKYRYSSQPLAIRNVEYIIVIIYKVFRVAHSIDYSHCVMLLIEGATQILHPYRQVERTAHYTTENCTSNVHKGKISSAHTGV